jgi:hypothetical protein
MTDAERHPSDTDRCSQDRRSQGVFRYPERRSGFERRARIVGIAGAPERALVFVRDHDAVLATMLAIVNVLNVSDLLLTVQLMRHGALEGNPVMDALLGADPVLAAAFKVLLLGAVSLVIWRMRRYRSILALALVALSGFVLLFGYELLLLSRIA